MGTRSRLLSEEGQRKLLAEHGIRVTEQRLAILRELARVKAPISHPELTHRLAETKLDRATVYRNLVSLTKAGLLVRTQLGDNVWRFELPQGAEADHGSHPHFVCTACGEIACLGAGSVTLRADTARYQVAEVQLRGLCGTCARS
jgi:Fur family ferric uptake transcriptional regulator